MKLPSLVTLFAIFLLHIQSCASGEAESNGISDMEEEQEEKSSSTDCVTAKKRCLHRQTCRDALIMVMSQCSSVAFGSAHIAVNSRSSLHCPIGCRNALASLISSDTGAQLIGCHCDGHKSCLVVRHGLQASCQHEVMQLIKMEVEEEKNAGISCSAAEAVCMGDTSCSVALEYQHALCQKMFRGQVCTLKCKNSLAVLHTQERAIQLKKCFCDGPHAIACARRRQHAEELCDLYGSDHSMQRKEPVTRLVALEDDERIPSYRMHSSDQTHFSMQSAQRPHSADHNPLLRQSSTSPQEEDGKPVIATSASAGVIIVPAWTRLLVNLALFSLLLFSA